MTRFASMCVFSTKYDVKLQTPEGRFVIMTADVYSMLKSIIAGLSDEELDKLIDFLLVLEAEENQ